MLDISKKEIEVNCPECKTGNTVRMQQVASEEKITCVGCQKEISLKDKDGSVKKSIDSVNGSLKDLGDAFKRLGK